MKAYLDEDTIAEFEFRTAGFCATCQRWKVLEAEVTERGLKPKKIRVKKISFKQVDNMPIYHILKEDVNP